MSASLILTVDHEVFGNGSGCIDACMIRPLARMLAVAERHTAPLTIFLEPLALALAERQGGKPKQHTSSAIRQVREAYDRGHDIQLHLHPQWWPVVARKPSAPESAFWRIGDLEEDTVSEMVVFAMEWIGDRLGSDIASSMSVFRAGGWCIQPEEVVLRVLKEHGFRADSTVASGMRSPARGTWYDFRNAPSLPCWTVDRSLITEGNGNILEVPICTASISRHVNIWKHAARRRRKGRGLAPGCKGTYGSPDGQWGTRWNIMWKVLTSNRSMLDFCTLPADVMTRMIEEYTRKHVAETADIPVVVIGHSKNFDACAEQELDKFLEGVFHKERYRFSTYGEWLDRYQL